MAPPPNIDFIKGCFDKIDADGNGTISMAELLDTFNKFDTDGDKKVNKAEFITAFCATFGATEEQSARAFGKLDTDGSGDLDLDELQGFFKKMDGDNDGNISKDEFVEFWKTLLS